MTTEVLKTKSKYKFSKKNYNTKKFRLTLDVNLKGFLCSCNFREKDCIKEAYNLLNKYLEKLNNNKQSLANSTRNNSVEDEDDIENLLSKEVQTLKDGNKFKQFQAIESGAKNIIFIRTTIDEPVELAKEIIEEINESKIQQTKFLIRLIPIEITCKAYTDDILKAFESLATKYFMEKSVTFSIVYNHRNNNNLSRDEIINKIATKVLALRDDHKVDLKNAQVSIIIEVIKGFAFLSVVPNYIKYKKYNLLVMSQRNDDNLIQKEEEEIPNSEVTD